MKKLIILLIAVFTLSATKKNPPTKKYYAFAVAWSTKDKKAFISPIKSCNFKDGERTGDIGIRYKTFNIQWREKVKAMYGVSGFYNTEFIGWYETAGEADRNRDYKITFNRNRLKYKVYHNHNFGFTPECK